MTLAGLLSGNQYSVNNRPPEQNTAVNGGTSNNQQGHRDRMEEVLGIMAMGGQADSVNMELMEEATIKETLVDLMLDLMEEMDRQEMVEDQDQQDLITREPLV